MVGADTGWIVAGMHDSTIWPLPMSNDPRNAMGVLGAVHVTESPIAVV